MKKMLSVVIIFFMSVVLSSCVFQNHPEDNKYYGPTYGEPMEKGNFIVCLRSDGYYQIIGLTEAAQEATALIFPDQIDGIPVMGIGIPDTFYFETYDYIHKELYVNRLNYYINTLNGSIDLETEPCATGWYMSMNNEGLFYMVTNKCEAIYINSHHVNDISRFLNIFMYSRGRDKHIPADGTIYDRYDHFWGKENENYSHTNPLGLHKTILNFNFGFNENDEYENDLINQFNYYRNGLIESKYWTYDDIKNYQTPYNKNVDIDNEMAVDYFWRNYYQFDTVIFNYNKDIEDYYKKNIISKYNYYKVCEVMETMFEDFCDYYKEFVGCEDIDEYNSSLNELYEYCKNYYEQYKVYPTEYDACLTMRSFFRVVNKMTIDSAVFKSCSLIANVEFRYNLEIDGKLYHNISHLDDLYWIDYVNDGDKVMKPTDPYIEGYRFIGWYKDSEYNNEWNFEEDTINKIENQDVWQTIYAKFEKIS